MWTQMEGPSGNRAEVVPIPKIPTRVRGLDEILMGGLPTGRITVLNGGPGSGKTMLVTEFLCRGAQAGAPGVLVSFEERTADLRANADSAGMNLTELEHRNKLKIVHANVPHGAIKAGDFNIGGLISLIEGSLQAVGGNRIVLDALDVLMRIFGDPAREREEFYTLHNWLRDRELTAIVTVKAATDRQQLYPFLDYMADCVISLDQRMDGEVRTRRLSVTKYRGSAFLSNEYPYILSAAGVVFMPVSSMLLPDIATAERISSGDATLDHVLGAGYRRASCVLLAGPSGAGKTLFACTFARAAGERGEKVLYVSFEESSSSLIDNVLNAGIDLRPGLEAGTLKVMTALPESTGVEQHLLRIVDAVVAEDPAHVVVDAISACHRMGSTKAAFDFLVRLLTACKQQGVTCLLTSQTAQRSSIDDLSGQGISSLVDTLVSLQYADLGTGLQRRVLVIKSRGSHHSMAYHDLKITNQGFVIAPVPVRPEGLQGGVDHE
ncbi:MAG: circadian clock protein KaiC [Thiogranum sp.]|nr:circadian clock protein KaiC [Thiogranum sp.]